VYAGLYYIVGTNPHKESTPLWGTQVSIPHKGNGLINILNYIFFWKCKNAQKNCVKGRFRGRV